MPDASKLRRQAYQKAAFLKSGGVRSTKNRVNAALEAPNTASGIVRIQWRHVAPRAQRSRKNSSCPCTAHNVNRPKVRRAVRNAIQSAIVGTAVEWYDYYLYATFAATMFNKLFFPSYDHLTGTLPAYASFAFGFFVRPVGSVIFGRVGYRIGRKKALIITLLLMGGSTKLIGLLPTYAMIGVWAPLLLCILRALQGLGSGAEYAGAVLMVIEYAPPKRRGPYGSLPYVGVALGLLMSLATFNISSNLSKGAFEQWGWRIPFVLSAVVVILGLVLRSSLKETPAFLVLQNATPWSRRRSGKSSAHRCALSCAHGVRVLATIRSPISMNRL